MQIIKQEHINKFSKNQIGGKAFYLNKLKEASFFVPDFIVIPTTLINELISPIRLEIENCINNDENLLQKSISISQKFSGLKFSKKLSEYLLEQCKNNFGDDYKLAIRSSAVDEDSDKTSFAGQHKSFMHVEKENLLQRIKEVIASAWSLNALSYRQKHQISKEKIAFAVIIQKMINAKKSGVGFSMNVQGDLADMVLIAGYGAGEGVVSDQIQTDSYYINRLTNQISKKITSKKKQLTYVKKQGLQLNKLQKDLQEKSVLKDAEIIQLAEVLKKTESILGTIADIEFSFAENGKLALLQLRPVTGIDVSDIKILDNTNIVESYPGVSLPLTSSFVKNAYYQVFKNATKAFFISNKQNGQLEKIFKDLVGTYQGKIYYRLDNWYQMMSQIYPSKKAMESWENAVGLKQDIVDQKHFSFGNKLRIYTAIIWLFLTYRIRNYSFFIRFNKDYKTLQSIDYKNLNPKTLLKHLKQSSNTIYRYWYITLLNDILSFKSFNLLQKMLVKYKIGSSELANNLLSGQVKSQSEEAILSLLSLKEYVNKNEELSSLFELSNTIIKREIKHDTYKDFRIKINKHLDDYGDRTLSELKLEVSSPRRDLNKFLNLLKSQLKTDTSVTSYKQQQKNNYNTALKTIDQKLKKWQLKRAFLFWIKRKAAYGLKNRENMRFARARLYSLAKDIYLEIGFSMQSQNLLKEATDIFYLTTSEIEQYTQDKNAINWKDTVDKRKEIYDNYKNAHSPDRIVFVGDKPPILSQELNDVYNDKDLLKGIAVSKGIVSSIAKIVYNPDYTLDLNNKILVTKITDPGWVFLMTQSVGLISEKGSLLSHTAIIGRELGIPVVVGVPDATKIIKDETKIILNGDNGTVKLLWE